MIVLDGTDGPSEFTFDLVAPFRAAVTGGAPLTLGAVIDAPGPNRELTFLMVPGPAGTPGESRLPDVIDGGDPNDTTGA